VRNQHGIALRRWQQNVGAKHNAVAHWNAASVLCSGLSVLEGLRQENIGTLTKQEAQQKV